MTAKFAGVTRFRLGVVNLPHTRPGASDGNKSCKTRAWREGLRARAQQPSEFVIPSALAARRRKLVKH
jgi:hypothetical protein